MKQALYLVVLILPVISSAKTNRCVEEIRLNGYDRILNTGDVVLVSNYGLPVKDNCHSSIVEEAVVTPTEMERLNPVTISVPQPAQSIEFATSSYSISTNAKKDLEQLALQLRQMPNLIVISGFADKTGPDAYNQELSEKRAAAVQKVLADKGVPSENIKTEAFGSEPTDASRRVDIKVSNF